jgi:hypothetical protein
LQKTENGFKIPFLVAKRFCFLSRSIFDCLNKIK